MRVFPQFKVVAACSGWRAQAQQVHGNQQKVSIPSHTLTSAWRASTTNIPPMYSDLRPPTAYATRGRTLCLCSHRLVHQGTNFRVPHPTHLGLGFWSGVVTYREPGIGTSCALCDGAIHIHVHHSMCTLGGRTWCSRVHPLAYSVLFLLLPVQNTELVDHEHS